jgi:hypothetical protein
LRLVETEQDGDKVVAVVVSTRNITLGERVQVNYAPKDGIQGWEDIFKCECCKCRGACGAGEQQETDFVRSVQERNQAEVHLPQLTGCIKVGAAVRVTWKREEVFGEVTAIKGAMCTVKMVNREAGKMERVTVMKSTCQPIPRQVRWKECQRGLEEQYVRQIMPAEAAASEVKYIESTVLQVLMEWTVLGATGRQGLPATAARVWIAAHDFSFVEGELKTLEGDDDEVMGNLVQRIEEWGILEERAHHYW